MASALRGLGEAFGGLKSTLLPRIRAVSCNSERVQTDGLNLITTVPHSDSPYVLIDWDRALFLVM